ncbi:MmgE/PrpD family protein [Polynucleobacter sp. Latsch14-2]|uniref:MmgE/PrpD family protein n=1 Tax=Polynucleobacter sp. Latsch14-2 TaxID=2576920 RepID=UPI001C0AA25F|nr:MmgE/PrpD family protein [Polynucleobacter sp. Latsch14-2]MBU3614331.1 MmgE/PrpD family protein [Polynucleobacter sp. Latsch14-2]
MNSKQRRSFLKSSATGIAAMALPGYTIFSAAAEQATTFENGKDATRILAQYALKTKYDDLPANIKREASRAFVNYIGVTVGSCRHEAVEISIDALRPVSGSSQATVLGRKERFDALNAAFINGVSSHVFDFDDTHLVTNVHAAGPIASALLAYSEIKPVTGREFMNAFYLGVEYSIRLSNALAPNHADIGWHVSGTAPCIGAAAAVGRLMNLSEQQMIWNLGLAASQQVGFRDSFGSMNKSFNPGRSAANGLFAALLAQRNFTSSNQMIESRIGWAAAMSTKCDYQEMLGDLGSRYEIAKDTYKPFACGIVIHPALDAAIQLRDQYKLKPDQIKSILIKANPYVVELTGKKTPQTGLEGKFSVYHSVAIAIIDGRAGEKQYSDAAVLSPKTIALRNKITVEIDKSLPKKSGEVTITLNDGRVLNKFIESAVGGVENPMTNEQLDAKFLDLTEDILPRARCKTLLADSWRMAELQSAGKFAKSTVA